MCGIFCEICCNSKSNSTSVEIDKDIEHLIKCRGPDAYCSVTHVVSGGRDRLVFLGSVLWMQGDTLTPQPLEDQFGVLAYNGDIFDSRWDKVTSDTSQIMQRLSYSGNSSSRHKHILKTISLLKGPFSLVYYDKLSNKLYFTRDVIGRNSLLFYENDGRIIISSVLGRKYEGAIEVPASYVFTLRLEDKQIASHCRYDLTPAGAVSVDDWVTALRDKQAAGDLQSDENEVEDVVPDREDYDLVNEIENIAKNTKSKSETLGKLLENIKIQSTVDRLTELLRASIKLRLEAQPFRCKLCIKKFKCVGHCTVGVLFSGGLDCTILALLADDYLPEDEPIDLINVAFKCNGGGSYDVPDRLTGRLACEELMRLRPTRNWNFQEVNVSEEELRAEQDSTIADLVYPRVTVLDESLGSALWFAARAVGAGGSSTCRVLLLGSGADELFGGYSRHRNSFRRHSWAGLRRELARDWGRIAHRNLARDNRVLGHHGRQPRMPYLDEDFTDYVLRLKPWFRCVPSEACGPGLGDKLFLRLVAFRLGLHQVSAFPKRALQFGSRIANKKQNGADVSQRFRNTHG